MTLLPDRVEALNRFIEERERVRVAKESGAPWPWTQDPILQRYKFCNIMRECDKTTRWIAANWRTPYAHDPHLWFAMVIARRALNWPGSMEALGYPVPWNSAEFFNLIRTRASANLKCYDTAYQLLVQGKKGDKAENMVKYILDPLWEAREQIRPRPGDTLKSFSERLSGFKFMGLFYCGQVVADLKYVYPLNEATDWQTFALPGPGSERGLNRIVGRDKKTLWRKGEWYETLCQLMPLIRTKLHFQDGNNILCEFDKFERIRLGEGRVRPYKPYQER
jgi:hypothetical protein